MFFRIMGNGEALFLHRQFGMDDFDQFQNAQAELSDDIQVLRRVFVNRMVRVLPECDIQTPRQDLYGPMLARGPAEKRNVRDFLLAMSLFRRPFVSARFPDFFRKSAS